jgi:hypothetical protein
MWKRIVAVLAIIGFLSLVAGAAGVGYFSLKTFKPEKVDTGLQQELSAPGVVLGKSTRDEVVARFGPPEQERQETLSTVLEYPSKKLLLRVDKASGLLGWVEYSSGVLATAKGIKVGSTYDAVVEAYGLPATVTPLSGGARVRYQFGMAYILEFLLDKSQRVTRIAFFKA